MSEWPLCPVCGKKPAWFDGGICMDCVHARAKVGSGAAQNCVCRTRKYETGPFRIGSREFYRCGRCLAERQTA